MARKLAVTELAKMGYCETLLVLNKKHNNAHKAYRDEAAIHRGNNEHDEFDARVKREHQPYGPVTDKRCFIATSVYGQEAIETERLRQWRDHSLSHKVGGVWFIETYYRLSPYVARLLDQHEPLRALVRTMLNALLRRL